jgi:hypothetical protein
MTMSWNGDRPTYSVEGWIADDASLPLRIAARAGMPRGGHAEDWQDLDMAAGQFSRDAAPVRL